MRVRFPLFPQNNLNNMTEINLRKIIKENAFWFMTHPLHDWCQEDLQGLIKCMQAAANQAIDVSAEAADECCDLPRGLNKSIQEVKNSIKCN